MQHAPSLIPAIIVLSLFLISGLLALGAALANWNWFFNSKNCRIFTSRLTRTQARWLYGILGILILLMTAVIARDLLARATPDSKPQPRPAVTVTATTKVYFDCNTSTNDLGNTIFSTPKALANSGAISRS